MLVTDEEVTMKPCFKTGACLSHMHTIPRMLPLFNNAQFTGHLVNFGLPQALGVKL